MPYSNNRDNSIEVRGGTPLRGTIKVAGSKNSIGKISAATMMTDDSCELSNVPLIGETIETFSLLEMVFGAQVRRLSERTFTVQCGHNNETAIYKVGSATFLSTRFPLLLVAPQLRKFGKAIIPRTMGGDPIGRRPIDLHLTGYTMLGAMIQSSPMGYLILAPKGLHGAMIQLSFPSVSATTSLVLAASLAYGITELRNVAVEPEVLELVRFLRVMGAEIRFDIDRRILTINGVKKLNGSSHNLIPDRLVAGSFAVAAVASEGDVTINGICLPDLDPIVNVLRQCGAGIQTFDNAIRCYARGDLRSITVEAAPFPCFPDDCMPALAVLLSKAHGTSTLHDTVFEGRIGHVGQIRKVGVRINVSRRCPAHTPCRFLNKLAPHVCQITGPNQILGGQMNVQDLRSGFAYILAGILSNQYCRIHNVGKLDRGYEDVFEILERLGAEIHPVSLTDSTAHQKQCLEPI